MTDDSFFRWVLLGGTLVAGCIGVYHRLRADTGEPIARREEGLFLLVSIRLVAAVVFCGFLAFLIQPAWMRWSSLHMPPWARWCGAALGGANVLFAWWVFHSLGRNITDTVVTRRAHTLVTFGPYRYVRHPFYITMVVFVASATLLASNWFIAVGGLLVFMLLALRTSIEEAKLIERFGDEYRDYMRRTGRFVPRMSGGDRKSV